MPDLRYSVRITHVRLRVPPLCSRIARSMEHRNHFHQGITDSVDQQQRQTGYRPLLGVGLPIVSRCAREDRQRPLSGSVGTFGVNAPWPGPGEHEVEEHKAVEDRQVASVLDRIDRTWRVTHEISERHIARQYECHRPSEKSEYEQKSANDLDNALIPDQGIPIRLVPAQSCAT